MNRKPSNIGNILFKTYKTGSCGFLKPWGGSLASPFKTCATKIACTLSLRSVNSEDSGCVSENAYPLSKNLLTISEGEVEDQAEFGLFDGRKERVKNRHRTFSLPSVSSGESGYLSGDAQFV